MDNSSIKSESFTFSGTPFDRHGVSVPGVLAAKDDLGIDRLLAVIRAGGADGIARLLLRSFEGNRICSGFHKKDLLSILTINNDSGNLHSRAFQWGT